MNDPEKPASTEKLHRAYSAKDAKETAGVYDDWAAEYEAHMKNVGYTHPAVVAAMAGRTLPRDVDRILDAGCGTGIMSEVLAAMGYRDVTGLDASEGMLAVAREKGRYRDLRHLFLGEPLDFADGHFAAVVAAGVFTQGHAPLDGLDELVRVTRSGGRLVFSVARTYLEGPFDEKRAALEDAGRWRFVDASEPYNSAPLEDTLVSRVFAFEVV